jgi:uncharacterized protein
MNINTTAKLADIQTVLNTHSEIQLAYVFGSIAKATSTPTSDLDIAIQTATPLGVHAKIQLIEELAAATGRAVDLIDLRTAGEPLLGEILRDGIRLTGSNSAHAETINRHLFDSADFLPYVRRMLAERRQRWTN